MSMDIAPQSVEPLKDYHIFDLTIPNLGTIKLLTDGLEYMIHNGTASNIKREFFDQKVKIDNFWKDGTMTSKARLTIEGDGKGNIKIKYYDTVIEAYYDSSLTFDKMIFKGSLARTDNIEGGTRS